MSTKRHDDSVRALSNQPIWELESDERLLDPGPGALGGRYDVLVVGGGVIGLATAVLCRRAGLGRVAVLERGRLAAGPSGRGAGILAPALHYGTGPECLIRLGHASLSLWNQLDREWGGDLGVQHLDVLQTVPAEGKAPPSSTPPSGAASTGAASGAAPGPEPGPDPGSGTGTRPAPHPTATTGTRPEPAPHPASGTGARPAPETLSNAGTRPAPHAPFGAGTRPAVEAGLGGVVLGPEAELGGEALAGEALGPEAARGVEPHLGTGGGGVLLRDQARVHPLRLAVALARRAGTVATRVQVTGIEDGGSAGVRVGTDQGDLRAGAVVLATGGAPAVRGLPPPSGQLLVKGTLITTVPAPLRLRVGVAGRGGLALQLPDGRLLFGNTFDPNDHSPEVRAETLAATRADLEALIPGAGGLPLSNAWTCFRPASSGGLPVIDKLQGLDRVWATYGHFRTGFLLAAATGQALATWISEGERPGEVAAFGARRAPRAPGPYLD